MPFITVKDALSLLVRVGAGAPILFLSSLGCSSRMWDYQMAAFATKGFRCIGFDRRGHGRSDQPAGGYDFDTFADDVATSSTTLISRTSPSSPIRWRAARAVAISPGTGANAWRASSSSRPRRRCC